MTNQFSMTINMNWNNMVVFNSSNERIIVKELTEKYDATINKFFDRSKYKGGFSYKVFINQAKDVFYFKSF